jgi:hypothetical protein
VHDEDDCLDFEIYIQDAVFDQGFGDLMAMGEGSGD